MKQTKKTMTKAGIVLLSGLVFAPGCTKKTTSVNVSKITNRKDLIGGPGALGEVGDYLLANDKIRVIIQSGKYSRGFGFYGGALIDADLQRPEAVGDGGGGHGYDNFSELFPAIFLKAMEPVDGGISTAVADDGSATVTVRGEAGDFLAMLSNINTFAVGDQRLIFFNEYKLRPGKSYVEITTTIVNQGTSTIQLPGEALTGLAGQDFPMPAGDVVLFGAGNKVFTPGAGFDLRYTLEDIYKQPGGLPQLPGLVTPFIATRGQNVSYGFMSGIQDEDLSYVKRAGYDNARVDDLLIPFIFSAFTGAFYGSPPERLKANEAFVFKKYFIVGSGDIASIRDRTHEIKEYKTGNFSGVVRENVSLQAQAGASIVTFDSDNKPYNQHTANSKGQFTGSYEPGKYTYVVVTEGRVSTEPAAFEIKTGETTSVDIYLPAPGYVSVSIRDKDGRPLPGKCTLVGIHKEVDPALTPKEYLFNLKIGEHRRFTDMIANGSDPKSREFIEHIVHAPNKTVTEIVRPGKYEAVCSRGIEYELARENIEVVAGKLAQVSVTLTKSVKTPGWASGDYHLHQLNSVDSDMPIPDRVIQSASEGLDIAVATDHNFVTDFRPEIAKLNLENRLQGMVGLEMTTLESGHFNSFPLRYDVGQITKGSFSWHNNTPTEVFEKLRENGIYGPENTIIQVNHPRDTILGYFNQYNFNSDTGKPEASADLFLTLSGRPFGPDKFDESYDALEVFNGKHFELLKHYRIPKELPPPPVPENLPPVGQILRDDPDDPSKGDIAFPGGMDDWFVLLNQGKRYTGTGNSDSHDAEEEPGSPRTYTPVSNDQAGQIDEMEIVRAMKSQQAMATNGPFILISVEGKGMGETVTAKNNKVAVSLRIQTPSWIDFEQVNFVVNGNTVQNLTGDRESLSAIDVDLEVSKDSWLIVEAVGSKSMWPVYTGLEVPSLQIGDAVGGLAGSFGIDLNPFGNLMPSQQSVTRAFAFTNPIYIDHDGDGQFTAPGVVSQALKLDTTSRGRAPRHAINKMPSLLKLFSVFKCHN
jgi:hypothetical protein